MASRDGDNHEHAEEGEEHISEEREKEKSSNLDNAEGDKKLCHWSQQEKQRLLADAITMKSPIEDIQTILKCGGKVNGPVKKGLRPLHYAAYIDYVDCIYFLIDKGADVNVSDDIGYTPLHLCARKGIYTAMKALIDKGALVNYCDAEEDEISENVRAIGYLTMEPLNLAIENNNVECVKLLLENGARPNHEFFIGYQLNVMSLENLECLEILLQNGADPNLINRCGISPLMKASREHNIEAVRMLLKYGADINAQCPSRFDQKTPLHFAIESGNIIIAQILVEHGANLSKPPNYRYSPLHTAVLKGRSDICYLLLLYKADVDERTDDDCTPLMLAAGTPDIREQKEIIKMLLEHGADVNANAQHLNYSQPCQAPIVEYLKNVTYNPSKEVLLTLLKYGANVNICNDVHIYRRNDPFGILKYLPNCTDKEMMDILIKSARIMNKEQIGKCDSISASERRYLLSSANTPVPLKHTIRLFIRDQLQLNLLDKVEHLPLPNFIKKYLLFEVN